MSMRSYPIYVPCAFVFTEDVIEALWDHNSGYEGVSEDSFYGDIIEDLDLENKLGLDCLGNFVGECRPIDPSVQDLHEYEDEGALYYLESDKAPTLFTQAYKGLHEDLVPEFRKKLKRYLPANFPIEKYLFSIAGYVWG